MSRKKVTLITGANGEIGTELINYFSKSTDKNIISLDLQPLNNSSKVQSHFTASILDKEILKHIDAEYEITEIYHLAAILSTKAEFSPIIANDVNVNGTLNLINLAINQATMSNNPVKFFFPSSIAVYGLEDKNYKKSVKENEFLFPKTMYGMNKLYSEQLGVYFENNYHEISKDFSKGLLDFRAIRFPGLISIVTLPTGGTSDYLPEMLHAANDNNLYTCFVNELAQLPFMVMPDAIEAIIKLMSIDKTNLNHSIYNISAFNPSVQEFYNKLVMYYPNFNITYDINNRRQDMVDGWPSNVDTSRAKYDWDWKPKYNFDSAFSHYFIPQLKSNS